MRRIALALILLAGMARAEPAPPDLAPGIASVQFGVFCALIAMDQRPAPGTESGWIHIPEGDIPLHWPDRQVVPASIGLAFGVKALGAPGTFVDAQIRVQRPDRPGPETWNATVSDAGDTFSFFRFDRPDELATGLWSFEAWDGPDRLYRVEFQVVPAAALPDIVQACGAVS